MGTMNRPKSYPVPATREQLTTEEKQQKIEKLWYQNPNLNEPTPNLAIPPSYAVTAQWLWYPWLKCEYLMDMEV